MNLRCGASFGADLDEGSDFGSSDSMCFWIVLRLSPLAPRSYVMAGASREISFTWMTLEVMVAGSTARRISPKVSACGALNPWGLPSSRPMIAPLPSSGSSFTLFTLTATPVPRRRADRDHPDDDDAEDNGADSHQCSFTYSKSTARLLMPRSGGAIQAAI